MALRIGVLMDDIVTIKPCKDTTLALMLAAQARGHVLYYFQQGDLWVETGEVKTSLQSICLSDHAENYYQLGEIETMRLADLDAILMRKDPPFDMEYIQTTYFLEMAEQQGTLIVNPPQALRTVNEKFFISYFPELTPKTLISRNINRIKAFIEDVGTAVVKPMDGMGGRGIFKVNKDDSNTNSILEALGNGQATVMVQAYLNAVVEGDKRILLVDGKAPQNGLVRLPQGRDFRANLAAGGLGVVQALTAREKWLCEQVGPTLKKQGLLFVGLDVIGGYLTEINVTSPTCVREIEAVSDERIAEHLMTVIEARQQI